MIYLLYLAWEDGRPIWHYIHPEVPDEMIEYIAGKDHSVITGFISALSMFSYEMLGSRIQTVILETVKITYRYVELNGHKIIAVAVTDLKDNVRVVWKIIDRFLNEQKEEILKITKPLQSDEYEKMSLKFESFFTKILKTCQRKIEVFAYRDLKSTLYSLITGLIIYAAMVGLVFLINKEFALTATERMDELLYVIILFNFIIPGILIGYVTGYTKGALLNSLLISVLTLLTLSAFWWDFIVGLSQNLLHVSKEAVLTGIILVSIVLGGGMGLIAAVVAWFVVETRTLVPPRLTLKP